LRAAVAALPPIARGGGETGRVLAGEVVEDGARAGDARARPAAQWRREGDYRAGRRLPGAPGQQCTQGETALGHAGPAGLLPAGAAPRLPADRALRGGGSRDPLSSRCRRDRARALQRILLDSATEEAGGATRRHAP